MLVVVSWEWDADNDVAWCWVQLIAVYKSFLETVYIPFSIDDGIERRDVV